MIIEPDINVEELVDNISSKLIMFQNSILASKRRQYTNHHIILYAEKQKIVLSR